MPETEADRAAIADSDKSRRCEHKEPSLVRDVPEFCDYQRSEAEIAGDNERIENEAKAREKAAAIALGAAGVAGAGGYTLVKTGSVLPALGFLGKYVVGPYAAWKSLPFVDWFANKMNKWADSLLKKNLPIVKPVFGYAAAAMDWVKMKIAPEKSLVEFIKKDKDERRKLVEKELKSLREGEKKLAEKQKKTAATEARRKALERRFGKEAADLLAGEIGDIETGEKEKTAEPAVESVKAE
jgi:hypothetical protein